jgi:hypothetical protein
VPVEVLGRKSSGVRVWRFYKLSFPADTWSMGGFGEIPYYENKVYIDHSKKRQMGVSLLAIDCEYENEKNAN